MAKEATYDATNIKILPGIEGVRKRPAMYIGDTNVRGLHHLVEEVVTNSVDEAVAGFCENISVRLNIDGSVTVTDDGRGIPVDLHKQAKKPALEVVMTTLHAGGKFDHKSYKVAAGLHGVGLSCVNALSEWLEADIKIGGKVYHQEFKRGRTASDLKVLGKAKGTGTKITFKPDPEIFEVTEFNYETVASRQRELAFLNSGLSIKVSDEATEREETFCYKGGLVAFVEHLNEGKTVLHKNVIHFAKQAGDISVELALQYTDAYTESILSFANNIHTHDGGTHLSGLKSALTRTFNNYARGQNLLKNAKPPSGDDIREGLTAVLSVMLPEPQFEAQSKNKLNNPSLEGIVESAVNELLGSFLEENPKVAKTIINKAIQAAQARDAARKARDLTRRKGFLTSGSLPLKLADCSSRDVKTTEIFIVEGQSAGGNAKQCRDSKFQAILPLQGKILNVEKARIDKMLNYEQISTLISALGTGIGADDFDPDKARYGKIIIMTDADVDGLHIRTLLLTFFFRHMRGLIERGSIYIAQPPLYGVKRKGKIQYYLDDDTFRKALLEQGTDGATLQCPRSKVELSGAKLRSFVNDLMALQGLARVLYRHGIAFREMLEAWLEKKQMPLFRVTIDGDTRLLYSQAEVDAAIEEAKQAKGHELAVSNGAEGEQEGAEGELDVFELHEVADIEKRIAKIQKAMFDMQNYFPPDVIDDETEPIYTLQANGDVIELHSLSEIPGAIRKLAEKGMETLQRYKGLGEMNADQLGETAMDPATRTLLRVVIEDAGEADRLFTLLMGDQVQPRRQFIEQHALEATDLDF